jgi:arylsulfatase A-like enzyme
MVDRPNVVVIVADTFRRDHLGAYGNPFIRTPHLDAFARSSVVFENHLLSSFPTMPARADFLTGTFSYTHMGWEPLPRHLMTLPEALSREGYLTMGIVDTPFFIRNGFGYDRGFEDFVWVRGQGDDTRPHERADARSTWRSEEDRMVARTMSEAERWLERHHKEERFFLYVDTWDPHEPWDAPEYYTSSYREGYEGEQIYPAYGKWQEAGLSRDDVDLAHATYCGEVTMVDFWVGRLLAKLDALNLRDNTVVLFTSDHGFYFGEHGYFGKAEWVHEPEASLTEDSSVPDWLAESWLLTVERSPLYKELTNVPLMVRGPGLEPGRRQAMTTAPDIAPTILELAGVDPPAPVRGESFLGVLNGESEEHRSFVVNSWPLYFAQGEITLAVDSRARRIASYMPLTVTTRDRTLIMGGPAETPELYDLASDPGEQNNIWGSNVEEGLALMRRAISFLEHQGTPEEYLAPRRMALQRFASGSSARGGPAHAGLHAGLAEMEERVQWTGKEAG